MAILTKPTTNKITHRGFNLEAVLDNKIAILDSMVTVNLKDYPTLRAAIDDLPVFGGNVLVPRGNFEAGDWTSSAPMSKANVSIIGVKMPIYNKSLTALVGGSVINGRFNVYADNFHVQDVGFDMGKDYCDVKFPGADFNTASHPLGGTWDALAFGTIERDYNPKNNLTVHNVIGLTHSSKCVAHSLLLEGFNGGDFRNLVAVYGVHGVVFKGLDFCASGIRSYGQQQNGCIIKSNSYALCGRASLTGMYYNKAPHGTTPWDVPASVWVALNFHAEDAAFVGSIVINDTVAVQPARHVYFEGQVTSSDVTIGSVITDGGNVTDYSVQLSNNATAPFARINIGSLKATNCVTGVQVDQPSPFFQQQLHIGSLELAGITGHGVVVGTNGNCTIDVYAARDVNFAYCIQGGGRLYVGREDIVNATAGKFSSAGGGFVPSLVNGWANKSETESQFEIMLYGYKMQARGTIKGGSNRLFMNLPGNLAPSKTERHIIAGFGTEFTANFAEITNSAASVVNIPPSDGLVCLDGLSWQY